jgi:hypothetical protein
MFPATFGKLRVGVTLDDTLAVGDTLAVPHKRKSGGIPEV